MNITKAVCVGVLAFAAHGTWADALQSLNDFVREAKSGRAQFTQTVLSPDGVRKKTSSGNFEFQRPNQFRFAYTRPFEQLIVADGQKVWLFDPDLNQASSRTMGTALGATPAALLAGGNLSKDFELKNLPDDKGLEWVLATPRQVDANVQSLRVGFQGKALAALEVVDGFGQRSTLQFSVMELNIKLPVDRFRFKLPKGADLIEQ